MRAGSAEKTVKLTGTTTEVPVRIYIYPYGMNEKGEFVNTPDDYIEETVKIVKKSRTLSLSEVKVKAYSEDDFKSATQDTYGDYRATIPYPDNEADVIITSYLETSKIGLIRINDDNTTTVLKEGKGQISVEGIDELTDQNDFYIVLTDGQATTKYNLTIVKYSSNTKVAMVIAERGTEDEYIAADASCGGGSDITPEGPNGTEEYPFEIKSAEELKNLAIYPNSHFVLKKDIDLTGIDWIPVGTESAPFTGSLKGNGKTISNLTINASDSNGTYGLFGVNDGVVGEVKRKLRLILIPGEVGIEQEVNACFRIKREKNIAVFRFLRCKIRFGGNAVDVELVGEVTALSA